MATNNVETQKGEVNVQTERSASPAFTMGYPYTSENKIKLFLNSAVGYLVAFLLVTGLIVTIVYLS